MQKRNVEQIILLFIVCAVLVGLLAWWVDSKNTAPELLLDEEGKSFEELDGPLSPEVLQDEYKATLNTMNPTAVFKTNKGVFEIELF